MFEREDEDRQVVSLNESSRVSSMHLISRLFTCVFDSPFEVVRIDLLSECCQFGVDLTIGLAALFRLG
jgi:hypothetical protein